VTLPLDGVTIVVTRPAAQASRLLELARAAGAACIPYPTLQIERIALDDAARTDAFALGADGHLYVAAHASLDGSTLTVRGFIGAPDGGETYRDKVTGPAAEAESLGRELARRMQSAGAESLLERLRQEAAATS